MGVVIWGLESNIWFGDTAEREEGVVMKGVFAEDGRLIGGGTTLVIIGGVTVTEGDIAVGTIIGSEVLRVLTEGAESSRDWRGVII